MLTETQLDDLLDKWAREYGHGRHNVGWHGVSPMQSVVDYHGKAPQVTGFRPHVVLGTLADKVEAAVVDLQPRHWVQCSVLRCEYLGHGNRPIEAKLDQLRALGMPQSRATYYRRLDEIRTLLCAVLDRVAAPLDIRETERA